MAVGNGSDGRDVDYDVKPSDPGGGGGGIVQIILKLLGLA